MGNLIHMDLYRMRKTRAFWVCLILALVLPIARPGVENLLIMVARMLSDEVPAVSDAVNLSGLISNALPIVNGMLCMISLSIFFYADIEFGYVKNIAGQMPKKGYTVLSKFISAILHNLIFMLAGVAGNIVGILIFQKLAVDSGIMDALRIFLLRFVLLQSLTSLLLLATTGVQSKSLGTVLAVVLGMGVMGLIYAGLDTAVDAVWKNKGFYIGDYMPDQMLGENAPETLRSLVSAAVTTLIFLPLTIRVFDRRDVK